MTLIELLKTKDPVKQELLRRQEMAKAQPPDVRKVAAALVRDRNKI